MFHSGFTIVRPVLSLQGKVTVTFWILRIVYKIPQIIHQLYSPELGKRKQAHLEKEDLGIGHDNILYLDLKYGPYS